MEILDQIESRIKKAMQTIEELQNRVKELEHQKSQYEEKLSSLLSHLDGFGGAEAQHSGSGEHHGEHSHF